MLCSSSCFVVKTKIDALSGLFRNLKSQFRTGAVNLIFSLVLPNLNLESVLKAMISSLLLFPSFFLFREDDAQRPYQGNPQNKQSELNHRFLEAFLLLQLGNQLGSRKINESTS